MQRELRGFAMKDIDCFSTFERAESKSDGETELLAGQLTCVRLIERMRSLRCRPDGI
jgi:hypothetical protein